MTALPVPTRVLHLVTRYRRGGSEQRVRDLVTALDHAEHVVVVGSESDAALASHQLGLPVEVEPCLVRSPRPDLDLRAIANVRRRLRRDSFDLVVTHQSKAGVVGRLAARLSRRVPVVHSLSMASFGPGYGRGQSAVFRTIERVLAPLTARYVVVGADLARRFEVAGIAPRKLTIVRSAASLPAPPPDDAPTVAGIPDGRPVVVALGALEDRKHPLDFVALLEEVRRSVPGAFLAVAGDGPLASPLQTAVAAAGLSEHVAVLGYVKPIDHLLWRADVLILLSDAEGLPQVLIQAAAAALPFVSYDVDGAREVLALGGVGDVVALGDVSAAARAVAARLAAPRDRTVRVDSTSWDAAVIRSAYQRVADEVLVERRRAG